jgi:hypothetical protein
MHFSFDSGSFAILCFGGFILVFFALVIAAISSAAKQKKAIQGMAQKNGFSPVKTLGEQYLNRLKAAYAPENLRQVKPLWQKTFPEGTIVIFDANTRQPGDDENSSAAQRGNLVLFSSLIDLPTFFIVPRVQAPLQLGTALDQMMVLGANRLGMSINQNIPPEFDRAYLLYCSPESANSTLLPEMALLYIAEHQGLFLRASADTLVLTAPYARQQQSLATPLAENIETLRELCIRLSIKNLKE